MPFLLFLKMQQNLKLLQIIGGILLNLSAHLQYDQSLRGFLARRDVRLLTTHRGPLEDSDQTAQMCRLI